VNPSAPRRTPGRAHTRPAQSGAPRLQSAELPGPRAKGWLPLGPCVEAPASAVRARMGLQWGLRWWEWWKWWELKWEGARARRQGPQALVFVLCTHLFPGAQVLELVEKIESGLSLDSAGGSPVGAGGEGSSAGAGALASPRLASAGGRGGARGSVSFQLQAGTPTPPPLLSPVLSSHAASLPPY
jgi:hypothetical protein